MIFLVNYQDRFIGFITGKSYEDAWYKLQKINKDWKIHKKKCIIEGTRGRATWKRENM